MATEYRVKNVFGNLSSETMNNRDYADRVAQREGGKVQKREVGEWQDA